MILARSGMLARGGGRRPSLPPQNGLDMLFSYFFARRRAILLPINLACPSPLEEILAENFPM